MKIDRTVAILAASVGAMTLLALLLASSPPRAESLVAVTNFPDVQKVTGTVRVRGLESFGSLESFEPVNVSPVARGATTRLIDGGVLETDGFSHVVLALLGEVRGELTRPGTLGAILIPDSDSAEKLLKTKSVFLFPIEVTTALTPDGASVFQSVPRRVQVAFPRYRVLYWNSSDRTMIATLSAYRTK